jgi:Short C-terminal domain
MFRRRRPVLRAAAVGGAAYYAGKKVQEGRDEDQLAAEDEAAALEAANDGLSDADIEQLQQLAKLKDQGVLTQEEFDAQKQKILGT